MKEKNMVVSIDTEKIFDEIQHPIIKVMNKFRIGRKYINIIDISYNKSTDYGMLNEEMRKTFHGLEHEKDVHFHNFYSTQCRLLVREIRQEEEIRGI
jgi:hypothetical protein